MSDHHETASIKPADVADNNDNDNNNDVDTAAANELASVGFLQNPGNADTIREVREPRERVVISDPDPRLSINHPENSDLARKITSDTWSVRYSKLVSRDGYFTGKTTLQIRSIANWLEVSGSYARPVAVFAESRFFYLGVQQLHLFADMLKLRDQPFFRQPLNYFAMYSSPNHTDDSRAHRLYDILRKGGYQLTVKRNMQADSRNNVRDGELINSIMPEFLAALMGEVYENDLTHILIMSREFYLLLPALQRLRKHGVMLSLAVASNQPVSNYNLSQFDHLVDFIDLLRYCGALAPFQPHNSGPNQASATPPAPPASGEYINPNSAKFVKDSTAADNNDDGK